MAEPLTTIIDAQALVKGTNVLSVEINNCFAELVDLEISFPAPGTPLKIGTTIQVFVLASIDNVTFPDGDAATLAEANAQCKVFDLRADDTIHKMTLTGLRIPPTKHKYLLVTDSITSLTVTMKELRSVHLRK